MIRRIKIPSSGFARTQTAAKPDADPNLARTTLVLTGNDLVPVLAEVATQTWKAKQRLEKSAATELSEDFARIARHVEAILDSLAELGLEIKNHTGEPYDYGQSLTVVASEQREGIRQEVVAETIRPSIFLRGHRIQQGEVVIATPVSRKD
jgi:hypothetical protein